MSTENLNNFSDIVFMFEEHLKLGVETSGLDPMSFNPVIVKDKETGFHGMGIQTIKGKSKKALDSMVFFFDDGLHVDGSGLSFPVTEEQPASKIAILVLTHLLQKRKVLRPICDECAEKLTEGCET